MSTVNGPSETGAVNAAVSPAEPNACERVGWTGLVAAHIIGRAPCLEAGARSRAQRC